MVAMTGFGASAPGDRLFEEFEFTPERAAAIVRQLLVRRSAGRDEPACTANPLVRLGELGQSPWYDYITRDLRHLRRARRGSSPRTASAA